MLPRTLRFGVTLALAAGVACTEKPAPTCTIAAQHQMPPGSLGQLPRGRLDRIGEGFVVIGHAVDGSEFRFASLSVTGTLGPETTLTLPGPRAAGPWFGLRGKTTPGDQLLVVYGVPVPPAMDRVALFVVAGTAGLPAAAPVPLLDPSGGHILLPNLPPGMPGAWDFTMGSTSAGDQAVIAYGPRMTAGVPTLLFVDDSGATRPLPAPLPGLPGADMTTSSCLAVTPSRLGFGVSRVIAPATPDGYPTWAFTEFGPGGASGMTFFFLVFSHEMGCPTVAPTPKGYAFAYQNSTGTFFANVDTTRGTEFYTTNIAKGAVRFGGPDEQPAVACIASGGDDFSLLFDAPAPLVERYSFQGAQQGGALALPTRLATAAAAAWPQAGSTFVTYLGEAAPTPARWLMRVDCPTKAVDKPE